MGAMSADDFGDERIKLSHQRASRLIIMLERSTNKRTCVSIIHVIESASTLVAMTATGALWLHLGCRRACAKRLSRASGVARSGYKKIVTSQSGCRSLLGEAKKHFARTTRNK